jgi:hypothetical protein
MDDVLPQSPKLVVVCVCKMNGLLFIGSVCSSCREPSVETHLTSLRSENRPTSQDTLDGILGAYLTGC